MAASECTLWYNPSCSKCKSALALLQQHGVEPALRLYLFDPPNDVELETLCAKLGGPPHTLARAGEDRYRELGLSPNTPWEAMIAALAADPTLIERPIFVYNGRAVVGRPPERVLELLKP